MRAELIYECLADLLDVEYEFAEQSRAEAVNPEAPDWRETTLPKALHDDLLAAVEDHSITDLRQHLVRLERLGDEGQSLVAHLGELAQRYDMDTIRMALEELQRRQGE